jgi:hypothetical protein
MYPACALARNTEQLQFPNENCVAKPTKSSLHITMVPRLYPFGKSSLSPSSATCACSWLGRGQIPLRLHRRRENLTMYSQRKERRVNWSMTTALTLRKDIRKSQVLRYVSASDGAVHDYLRTSNYKCFTPAQACRPRRGV